MIDKIQPVRPGQRVSAAHINRIADVAARGVSGPGLVRTQRPGEQMISIRDPLGRAEAAIIVWGVLGVTADAVEAYQAMAIGSDAPDWGGGPGDDTRAVWLEDFDSGNLDRMAVALEPIQPGRAGRIAIAGTAYVLTDGGAGAYGQPAIGSRALAGALSGPAQILSHDTVAQVAFVRFPVGGEGGSGGSQWQFVWNEGADL